MGEEEEDDGVCKTCGPDFDFDDEELEEEE